MSLLERVERGTAKPPRRTLLYGVHGVGKSTFGADAESPVFIQTEDGLAHLGTDRFPLATSLGSVRQAIHELYAAEHPYRTVVIDSLDWLERLIWEQVCADKGVTSVEDIGYAKGYVYAVAHWRELLDGLDHLRGDRGMAVILIAHAKIERFENPETEPYDRYSPRLHKLASALVQEWCDEVLFATYQVNTRKAGKKFDKDRHIGIGDGQRVCRTTERPAHVAKNRLGLPDQIPLDFATYAAFCRGETPAAAEPEAEAE